MHKALPYILGFWGGLIVCSFIALVLIIRSRDPRFDLVVVSWEAHTDNDDLWIYQAQVTGSDEDKNGVMEISARVSIGRANSYHDLGVIGGADNMGDAVKRFATISWHPDKLTIGGSQGIKATLLRSELQRHR